MFDVQSPDPHLVAQNERSQNQPLNAWKPRLTWKSILVFEPTGGGQFSNLNISKVVGDINKLISKYENLVF